MLWLFGRGVQTETGGDGRGFGRGARRRPRERATFPVAISASGDAATPGAVCVDGIVCGAPAHSSIVVDWTAASGKAGVTAFAPGSDGTGRVRLLTIDLESSMFPITVRAALISAPNSQVGDPVVIDQALAETLARCPAAGPVNAPAS